MSSVLPDLNYADIKEVECALSAQPGLSCRYQIRIGGKVLGTGRGREGWRGDLELGLRLLISDLEK